MFSIGENGDIYIHEDGTFTDIVIGDSIETEFRIARSRIISHFKFKNFFRDRFIKYFRNNFNNESIQELLNNELNSLFSDEVNIRNKIIFFFKNNMNKFDIVFIFKESNNKNRNLLYYSLEC